MTPNIGVYKVAIEEDTGFESLYHEKTFGSFKEALELANSNPKYTKIQYLLGCDILNLRRHEFLGATFWIADTRFLD